jgi:hypothetical protein
MVLKKELKRSKKNIKNKSLFKKSSNQWAKASLSEAVRMWQHFRDNVCLSCQSDEIFRRINAIFVDIDIELDKVTSPVQELSVNWY